MDGNINRTPAALAIDSGHSQAIGSGTVANVATTVATTNSMVSQHLTNDSQNVNNDLSIATLYNPYHIQPQQSLHALKGPGTAMPMSTTTAAITPATTTMSELFRNANTSRIMFTSHPSPNRIASCDNLATNQNVSIRLNTTNGTTNCTNFRLVRNNSTLDRRRRPMLCTGAGAGAGRGMQVCPIGAVGAVGGGSAIDSGRTNRIMQNQSFKSTPDLTSTDANIELPTFAGIKCCSTIGRCAIVAPNHPDVISMNIYRPASPVWLSSFRNTNAKQQQQHHALRQEHNTNATNNTTTTTTTTFE